MADPTLLGDDASHEPLAGVRVLLLDEQGVEIDDTTTDSHGDYEFTDLRPGSYSVVEITPVHQLHQ